MTNKETVQTMIDFYNLKNEKLKNGLNIRQQIIEEIATKGSSDHPRSKWLERSAALVLVTLSSIIVEFNNKNSEDIVSKQDLADILAICLQHINKPKA